MEEGYQGLPSHFAPRGWVGLFAHPLCWVSLCEPTAGWWRAALSWGSGSSEAGYISQMLSWIQLPSLLQFLPQC